MFARYKMNRILIDTILIFLLFIFLIPILQTITTSIKPDEEIYNIPVTLVPHDFSFEHYLHVFSKLREDFLGFFKNSVVVTASSVFLILLFSSLAAYGLSRIDFAGKKFIIFFVSFIVSIPLIITVIPIFIMETNLGLKNTNLGLILPYTAVYMPVPLFILYSTYLKIPSELEESAFMDGANRLTIFSRVFVPLSGGGLVAAAIISFLYTWGEFLYALILTTRKSATTLPIGILMINEEEQAWALGPMSAVMVLSTLIPLVLYLILQRYFVRGLMEGSLKG